MVQPMTPMLYYSQLMERNFKREVIMRNLILRISTIFILMSGFCAANAAQLDLAKEPLELSQSVEPNIMLLIDDSGSMDFEVMTEDFGEDGAFTGNQPDGSNVSSAGNIKNRDANDNGYINCYPYSGTFNGYIYGIEFGSNVYEDNSSDCNTADDESWRFRNSDFNKMYYNPQRVYKPWKGVDSNGVSFKDINVNKAPNNPYLPTEYVDLTKHNSNWSGKSSAWSSERATSDRNSDGVYDGFRYYTWVDKDNDGRFDNGEETEHLIKDKSTAEQQNFANWFSYHRSRALAVKSVLSEVLEDVTNVRVGFATINGSNKRKMNASMNASPTTGLKKQLYDGIFGSVPAELGTPLRKSLAEVGQYYACAGVDIFGRSSASSPGDASCPVLPSPQGECQQNYTLLLTDGFYNGNSYQFYNQDKSGNFAGGAFADNVNNTLADIAMYYYKNDIQTGLDDRVSATTIDAQRSDLKKGDLMHQNMKSYALSFGLEGSVLDFPSDYTKPFSWPNPFSGYSDKQKKSKIDDLRHAAYNGRGDFLSVKEPDALIDAVKEMIDQIREEAGTASAVAFNTQSISTKSLVYRAFYNTKDDTGDLVAQKMDSNGGITESIVWSASEMLDKKKNRNIFTYNGAKGVEFKEGYLNGVQKNHLNTPYPSNLPYNYGNNDSDIIDERIDYLIGDRANEGLSASKGEFRERISTKGILGDIINSTPVYVGASPFSKRDVYPYPTNKPYSGYRTNTESRREMIYVGANDGMLHGFDANTGEEVFGYVPSPVYNNLSELTNPAYTHEYYVDGSPAANDAFVNGSWKTLLVGGLRAGGKGYYAIDVTDPDSVSKNSVLWEFTESDDGSVGNSDLGFSYSTPVIAMANSKSGSEKDWVMIFGNGYNSTSSSGESALYVVKLSDKSFVKIKTGFGKAYTKNGVPNGLGQPRAVDEDGDGTVDYVYAGDLAGNMYRFDLTSSNKNKWDEPVLLYTSKNDAGDVQPITSQPAVVRNSMDDLVVVFGTGSWMTNRDATDNSVQSLYGIVDDLSISKKTGKKDAGAIVSKDKLIEQSYIDAIINVNGDNLDIRKLSNNDVDYAKGDMGWYINFDSKNGERAIRQLQIRGGIGFVNTVFPNNKSVCVPAEGGYELAFDPLSGGGPDDVVFDIDGDGEFTSDDLADSSDGENNGNDSSDGENNGNGNTGNLNINTSQVLGIKRETPLTDSAFLGDIKYTQLTDKSLISIKTNTMKGGKTGRFSWTRMD